jgi:pyruvate,water dikinase
MASQKISAWLYLSMDAPDATVERVGGKGAALARLAAAGLPVPPGVHLTTAAYSQFVEANGLQPAILKLAGNAAPGDPAALEQAASAIHALLEGAAIPDEVATALRQAYRTLQTPGDDAPAVAVRSSATAEDLPELSFAGQQETFLNVRGEAAVLDAVRRCWASLWTARAIAYRARMGVAHDQVAMAALVQRLIPAEVAGVLFTANPSTGRRGELVVSANFGLGESIVSGQVTPDTYVLDRAGLSVKAFQPGTKQSMIVAAPDQGTVQRPVAAERRGEQALSEPALRALAELALRAEALAGGVPQDVEWAIADGTVWLLQARPVTALPAGGPLGTADAETLWQSPEAGVQWVRRQAAENMTEPLSPLFAELYLREGLERSSNEMQAAMGVPRRYIAKLVDRPMFATINGYAYMRGTFHFNWWTIPVTIVAMVAGVTRLLRGAGIAYWQTVLPDYLKSIARWQAVEPARAPDEELLDGVRELAYADARYWFACTLALGTAKSTDVLFDRFLAMAAPRRGLTSGLFLRGFESKILAAEVELEAIADRIRASAALRAVFASVPAEALMPALAGSNDGAALLDRLQGYFERYGHQVYNIDFAVPTQAEDPLPVLVGLKGRAQQPGRDGEGLQARLAREREALVRETAQSFGPLRRDLFMRLLRLAQRFGPYREEALFYIGAAWPTLRRLAHELGRRLVAAGSLETPDDVFYLETAELRAASAARVAGDARPDLARLAQERRNRRERQKRLQPPPAVPPAFRWKLGPIDLAGRESQRRNPGEGPLLRGFAVSPGQVTAPASVVLSPADFAQMQPGTILVCPATTPAWTPLFAQALGLVTDVGGVAAHGSIVAREYGIPAVMGVGGATRRIASGQVISIDGSAGTVTLGAAAGPV